jgi:hypothetical protein
MTKFEFSDYYTHAREGSHETSHRETAENYANVVYQRGRYRVIVSRDDVQWIFQQRYGATLRTAEWRSISYHIERDALIRRSKGCFTLTPIELLELPPFFRRGGK